MIDRTEKKSWRETAARIVEELFPTTQPLHWDLLLDLRGSLLTSDDWNAVVSEFMICRAVLEQDHYLPFYRLRRVLAAHLRLEGVDGANLGRLLRQKKMPERILCGSVKLVENFVV